MQPPMPPAASEDPERSEGRGPVGRMPCPSKRTTNGVPASATKTGAKRSPGFGKRSTRDANKPEEEKNWWASAHFRRLGAGAVGVNLVRSDVRIERANKLSIGLALC
jgi:hypothetical protein